MGEDYSVARKVNDTYAVIARRFVGDDLSPLDSARVPYSEIVALSTALNDLFAHVATSGLSPRSIALLEQSQRTSNKIKTMLDAAEQGKGEG